MTPKGKGGTRELGDRVSEAVEVARDVHCHKGDLMLGCRCVNEAKQVVTLSRARSAAVELENVGKIVEKKKDGTPQPKRTFRAQGSQHRH